MSNLHRMPRILFRAFTNKRYAIEFVQGKIRLGELGHYRRIENLARKDISEGQSCYIDAMKNERRTELGGPIYILSLSGAEVDANFLAEKMGCFIVRINDPQDLARGIEDYLERQGIRSFNGVYGRPVEYTKGRAITQAMDAGQRATLSVTQKPNTYREECEYRLYTILNQDPRHRVAEFLNIELGRPISSAEIVRVVEPMVGM